MHRIAYLCGAGVIACGLFVLLTACGGGECDQSCKDDLHEATTLPVNCSASGVCK